MAKLTEKMTSECLNDMVKNTNSRKETVVTTQFLPKAMPNIWFITITSLHVAKELKTNHGRQDEVSEEGWPLNGGSIETVLGVSGGIAEEVNDASKSPHSTGSSGVGGVAQSSDRHKPQLSVVGLKHVLVTTLDGVEAGLGVIVHSGVLRAFLAKIGLVYC